MEDEDAYRIVFTLTYRKEVMATGMLVPDGFLVLKGSKLVNRLGVPKGIIETRRNALRDRKITIYRVFQEDWRADFFKEAASVILGSNNCGLDVWVAEDGRTMREVLGVE